MNDNLITELLQLTADIAEELLAAKDNSLSFPERSTCEKIECLYSMTTGRLSAEDNKSTEVCAPAIMHIDEYPSAGDDTADTDAESATEMIEIIDEPEATDGVEDNSRTYSETDTEKEAETAEAEEAADALPEAPSAADLKRAMSINDVFLFRRALFQGSASRMQSALTDIAECSGISEVSHLLAERYGLNLKQPESKAFISFLQPFFDI